MKNLRKGWAVCSLENMRGCVTWQVKAKFSIILGVERYVSILIFLHRRTLDLCVSVSLIFSWLLILTSATYFLIFHSVNLLDYNIFIKKLPNIYLWFVPHTPFFQTCYYCVITFVFLSPHIIFLSQSVLSAGSPGSEESLSLCGSRICHEISHSWFGLVIGARDWTEEWISEGFATCLEDIIWAQAQQV